MLADRTRMQGNTYFIFCGGQTNKVHKLDPSDLTEIAASADYGGSVTCVTAHGEYVYCGGNTTQKIWKIRISDMAKVSESADLGGGSRKLVHDGQYLYAVGLFNKVIKIDPSDMSTVASSSSYGNSLQSVCELGDHVYAGRYSNAYLYKFAKSNLSEISSYRYNTAADHVYCVTTDGEFLYCGGWTKQRMDKINTSMSFQAQSDAYGASFRAATIDNEFLYAGGNTILKVWQIDTSDMSKNAESAAMTPGTNIGSIHFDGYFIYAVADNTEKKVWKIDPSDMSKKAMSDAFSVHMLSITSNAKRRRNNSN